MKTFTIDIHPKLTAVTFTIKNGRKFSDAAINGTYMNHTIQIAPADVARVKRFAVKYGNDKNSNRGKWYAHCNGYAMDLLVTYSGEATINTYRPYGKVK